jgi:hypothetical protein
MSSPCGENCSYVMEFEGPWIECTNTTETLVLNQVTNLKQFPIYSGWWTAAPVAFLVGSRYNGTYTLATYNSSILTPLTANPEVFADAPNGTFSIRQDNVTCSPGRAMFKVNNTFTNNIQRRSVAVQPIDKLINLAPLTFNGDVKVPGFTASTGFGYGTAPANWSDYALDYYRDNNLMTIFTATLSWLNGEFLATPSYNPLSTPDNATVIDGLFWKENIVTTPQGTTVRTSGASSPLLLAAI